MTMLQRPVLTLTLAVLVSFAGAAAAQEKPQEKPKDPPKATAAAVDVTGTWDVSVETPQGAATLTATFKQEGEKLTGTLSSQMGEMPLEGTVKGAEIAFAIVMNMQGQELRIAYTGKVEGDAMSGAIEFGSYGTSSWAAKKRPALP
jgi:hypothetical protein